jgi:two-component sensor histidine kinase
MALAKAHALTLRKHSDSGQAEEQSTTLHALLATILSPFDGRTNDDQPRVAISGPDIPIVGGAVTSFALLLHEFATNAAKYGALSAPNGTIKIVCSEAGGQFDLTWEERGGPPVDHQADGDGFGSVLIRATGAQLGGEITRQWTPGGAIIHLSLPRDRLAD